MKDGRINSVQSSHPFDNPEPQLKMLKAHNLR